MAVGRASVGATRVGRKRVEYFMQFAAKRQKERHHRVGFRGRSRAAYHAKLSATTGSGSAPELGAGRDDGDDRDGGCTRGDERFMKVHAIVARSAPNKHRDFGDLPWECDVASRE